MTFMKRVSITLAICALAGGAAVVGLARPATDTTTAQAETAQAAASAEPATDPYGSGQPATGQASQTPAPAPAAAAPAVVTIEGFAFGGATTAQPGATVTVQNLDSAPHTMTARDGSFDTGTIGGGESGTLTLPDQPGTYEFFCAIHPSMVASITVTG
jgi:plastocyanin